MKVKEESGKAGLKLNTQKTKIMASSSITLWQIGKQCKQWQILFSWAPNSLKKVTAAMKLKDTCSWKKSNDKPNQRIEKQRHYFAHKSPSRLWFFLWSCRGVRVGLWRRLSAEELMLLNCGVREDSWGPLGLQGDPTSPFWRRSALGFLWKEWC